MVVTQGIVRKSEQCHDYIQCVGSPRALVESAAGGRSLSSHPVAEVFLAAPCGALFSCFSSFFEQETQFSDYFLRTVDIDIK